MIAPSCNPHFLVVKSISFGLGLSPPTAARSQVHEPAGRLPHSHVLPEGGAAFSFAALSHVHWPAGRARHEHRAPLSEFSVAALWQVQWSADWLPQEQVACLAVVHQYFTRRREVLGLMRRGLIG